MPRKRWFIAVAALVVLLIAAEVWIRMSVRPTVSVGIMNESGTGAEGVTVIYGDSRIALESIAPGQSALVHLTAGSPGPLRVEYYPKGRELRSIEIADFDPATLIADRMRHVIVIVGPGLDRNYVTEDHDGDDEESFGQMLWRWVSADFDQARP